MQQIGEKQVRRLLAAALVACLSAGIAWAATSLAAGSGQDEEVIARLVGLTGEVMIQSGGRVRKAAVGEAIRKGDLLITGTSGQATMITADDHKVIVRANSKVRAGNTLQAESGQAPEKGGLLKGMFGFVANKFKSSKEASTLVGNVSALRGEEPAPVPIALSPRNTWVLAGRPELSWQATGQAVYYRLTLTAPDGRKWEAEVRPPVDCHMGDEPPVVKEEYPEAFPPLEAGAYRWTVTEVRSDGSTAQSAAVWMERLPADEQEAAGAAIDSARAGAGEDPGSQLVLASTYEFFGLFGEAIQTYEQAARAWPAEPAIYELLGESYLSVDLVQRAKKAFEKADALRQANW